MRLLLDTHALFWSIMEDEWLSSRAADAIKSTDSEVYVSIASVWEMAIKVGIGKWPEAAEFLRTIEQELAVPDFRQLPLSVDHVRAAGLLASPHRDPFDRLLTAPATIEGLTLVTADERLAQLGTDVLW